MLTHYFDNVTSLPLCWEGERKTDAMLATRVEKQVTCQDCAYIMATETPKEKESIDLLYQRGVEAMRSYNASEKQYGLKYDKPEFDTINPKSSWLAKLAMKLGRK